MTDRMDIEELERLLGAEGSIETVLQAEHAILAAAPALIAEVKELREALEPFAKLADEIAYLAQHESDPKFRNPENWAKTCQWKDLERARQALKEQKS